MEELYKLKEMLCKELEEYGEKGEMTAGTLDVVDKLAHALKNIDKIIEYKEMDEGSYMGGGSYARGGRGGYSREGGSYRGGQGGSYARGRNQYSRRESRYSGRGYSRDGGEEYVEELRELMQDLPPEAKQHVQKAIQAME